MSTISSVQEAREALCNGELFQVGGRFINPSDIVEVDPNGGENPIFYLEDGRSVQHNRFTPGDAGDFLAAALEYAQRGGAQSEAIKPAFNRVLVGENAYAVTDGDLTTLNAVPNVNLTHYHSLDVSNKIATGVAVNNNGSVRSIVVHDYGEGNTSEFGPTIGGNSVGFEAGTATEPGQQRVWIHGTDGSDNSHIQRIDYDGQNGTTVFGNFETTPNPTDENIGIDPVNGFGFAVANSNLYRFKLDGTGSPTSLGSVPERELDVDPQTERILLFPDQPDPVHIYDYNGNQISTFNYSRDVQSMAWVPGEDQVLVADRSTDTITQATLGGKETVLANRSIGARVGIDVGLNLSAV